jgi:hypothetical protein
MQRLFELPTPEKLTRIHKKCWDIDERSNIGPVNTNFFLNTRKIRMVIICESPSYLEVANGFPTVGTTGKCIFNNLVRSGVINSSEDELPSKYCYPTHYKLFEKYGIYITNLVRFQADFGIKSDVALKNKKVKKAWNINKRFLFEELSKINENFGNTPVLIACGSAFASQICEVVQYLINFNMPWFVTSHPSRSKKAHSDNYNHQKWSDRNIKTTSLAKKITNKFK